MIKKLIIYLLLLIVIALASAYFYRNALVKTAVEESGDYVLGVKTELGSANLDLGGGSLSLSNYSISNPEGFEKENFLILKQGLLDVNSGSVLDDEVIIDSLVLDGFQLSLEQIDKKGNYLVILENLKKFEVSSSSKSEKRLKIDKVILRDIGVDATLTLLGKKQGEKSFKLDDITLNNVGGTNGTTVSGLIKTVVSEVLAKATTGGKGLFGIDVGGQVDKLKEEGVEKVKDAAKEKLKGLGL